MMNPTMIWSTTLIMYKLLYTNILLNNSYTGGLTSHFRLLSIYHHSVTSSTRIKHHLTKLQIQQSTIYASIKIINIFFYSQNDKKSIYYVYR
ncbi:hypothetical protein ACJX0J_033487 [Zea mays]